MNEIVKIFLLAGYKFVLEMHLRELAALVKPNFKYSACRPFLSLGKAGVKGEESLRKQEIRHLPIEINKKKFVCIIIWLMEILKILRKKTSDSR